MEQTKKGSTVQTEKVEAVRDAVKDAGLVRLGTGCIYFDDQPTVRAATKDTGRVRMGTGCIQY